MKLRHSVRKRGVKFPDRSLDDSAETLLKLGP